MHTWMHTWNSVAGGLLGTVHSQVTGRAEPGVSREKRRPADMQWPVLGSGLFWAVACPGQWPVLGGGLENQVPSALSSGRQQDGGRLTSVSTGNYH